MGGDGGGVREGVCLLPLVDRPRRVKEEVDIAVAMWFGKEAIRVVWVSCKLRVVVRQARNFLLFQ